MENNRFFLVINRVNAVIFLLFIVFIFGLFIFELTRPNKWNEKRSVEIKNENSKDNDDKISFQLEDIEQVNGHDIQLVKLRSKSEGGKFSPGYRSGNIKNVLFILGSEIETKWLFDTNQYSIECVCVLYLRNKDNAESPALAMYLIVEKSDTNKDGIIDSGDLKEIALVKVDGSNYTPIEHDVDQVISSKISQDGSSLSLILQFGTKINLAKYSLISFEKISERELNNISKKI